MVIIMFEKLDVSQVEYIYNKYMTVDFPPDELKPLSHILKMMDDGICAAYALFSENDMQSYFFLCEKDNYVLVDYLAVNLEKRGQGIGTKTLRALKEIAKDKLILVECEDILFSVDDTEAEIRKRRIAFYERAGFSLSGVKTKLFGVRYVILTFPEADLSDVEKSIGAVYFQMLGKEMFDKNFQIC